MSSLVPSVKHMLTQQLRESMLVAFPLGYKLKKKQPPVGEMLHVGQAWHLPQKKCDYFSTSGELIFRGNVKRDEESGSYEKGYFGLPSPMEVSHDLMTQMPDRSSDILQAMEIEQYFFADEAQSTREDPHLVNGYHINFYLRDAFVRQCKSSSLTLV